MRRVYRQVRNQAGEWELIEVGEPELGRPRLQIMGAKVREAYRSPIDGSIITSERSEREHMRRHGVVRPGDFGPNEGRDFFHRAAVERQKFFNGESSKHRKEVKKDLIESLKKVEQGYKPKIAKEGEL